MLKREDGSSLVELAVILPLLMLILTGAVDFGRAYFIGIEVQSAAEAGALYGTQQSSDTNGMTAAALLDATEVPGLQAVASNGCECADGSGAQLNCTTTPSCTANVVNYVEVDTQTTYQPMLPYPTIPSAFVLNGKARIRAGQ